jgi:NAD(P)-dependent dehydrogenase (short-subunit alcohol dehydrogenase family)
MFYLSKAAAAHMAPGGSIVNTASIQADSPSPELLPYAATKGAITNFTAALCSWPLMRRVTFPARCCP